MVECNSKTVVGGLAALLEASGIKLDGDALEPLGIQGEVQYNRTTNKVGAELHSEVPKNSDEEQAIAAHKNKLNANVIQKILVDQRNPSGVLGEDFVAPVLKFSSDFHASNWHNLPAARGNYQKGMKAVLNGLDTSSLTATQKGYFEEWKNHLLDGGVFYGGVGQKNGLTTAAGNWVSNTIKSSPHVLQGHFIASTLKLGALYPTTAVQGFFKAASKGLFFEIPELRDAGLYGLQHAETHSQSIFKKNWDGLIKLIDTPVANTFYYAGEAQGGMAEGLAAAQRGAFKVRLNDTPRQLWSQEGRSQNRLINWTLNSMKLYTSLWYDVGAKPLKEKPAALASLALMHTLPFIVGGAYAASQGKDFNYGGLATAIPAPITTAMGWVNPEIAQGVKQNKTGFSEMMAVKNLSGIGAAWEGASRTFQNAPKSIGKAADYLRAGDVTNALYELGDAGLSLMKFFNPKGVAGVINDGTIQKTYDIFKKDSEGTATEDVGASLEHLLIPATK